MDFYNGKDLLKQCQEMNAPISDIMKLRETTTGSLSIEEVDAKLEKALSRQISIIYHQRHKGDLKGVKKKIDCLPGRLLCSSSGNQKIVEQCFKRAQRT